MPPFLSELEAYQFVEWQAYLKKLRELIGSGTEQAVKRVKLLGEGFNRLKSFTNTTLESLGLLMEGEIAKLTPYLTVDLTIDSLLSHVAGSLGVVSRLPSQVLPLVIKGSISLPTAPSEGTTEGGAVKPELPTLEEVLFPNPEPEIVAVHLPALEKAVQAIEAAPVKLGKNYIETAKHVREGAFAITTDMSSKAVEDIRNELGKALVEGKSQEEFIDVVTKRISEEGNPISPPHIENVFRTNAMTAYSNSQYEAVTSNPLVNDAFPYGGYGATHDDRVRDEHKELEHLGIDGTNVYRIDDPTFIAFRPPWSFNCRCHWYPVTIEQAARKGIMEAKEWVDRAKARAKEKGGTFYQYLNATKPDNPTYVTPPDFKPDPNFSRDKA